MDEINLIKGCQMDENVTPPPQPPPPLSLFLLSRSNPAVDSPSKADWPYHYFMLLWSPGHKSLIDFCNIPQVSGTTARSDYIQHILLGLFTQLQPQGGWSPTFKIYSPHPSLSPR